MITVTDAIDGLKSLTDKSVCGVVTSPPYNINVNYDAYKDNRKDYVEWSISWLTEAVRVSKYGVMLNIGAKASDRNALYILLGEIAKKVYYPKYNYMG